MRTRLQTVARTGMVMLAAALAACHTAPPMKSPAKHAAPVQQTPPSAAQEVVRPALPTAADAVQPAPEVRPGAPMSIRLPVAASVSHAPTRLADGHDVPAVQGLLARAAVFEARAAWEDAAQLLERAQRLAPQSATVYQRLAAVRLRQNRTADAEQLARKGLAFAVGNAQQAALWRILATAAERQGKLDISLQAKARAAQLEALGDRS